MKLNRAAALVIMLTSASLTWSQSDGVKGRLGVGVQGGVAIPLGQESVRDEGSSGVGLGGQVRYGVTRNVEAALSYDNLDMDLSQDTRVEPVILSGIYNFTPDRKWTPLVEAGLGAGSSIQSGSFDNFAAKAALGLDYFVGTNVAIGPRLTYHYVSETGDADRHYHVLTPGGALTLFFNPSAQAKPAAAPAPAAAAPPPPAPAVVAAPVVVPVDSDGDGVLDSADRCPGTPRGIAVESNGCPKAIEERVSITMNVLFDSGKADIKPAYDPEVEKVANFLKAYPNVTATIEGHTDSTGSREFNTSLSQRRADAIQKALVARYGIDAGRVTAKGYGPDRPIADNKTTEGRAQNRRVVAEISAIKKVR